LPEIDEQVVASRLFSVSPHSAEIHPRCSMRWSAGYSALSSICNTSSVVCRIHFATQIEIGGDRHDGFTLS